MVLSVTALAAAHAFFEAMIVNGSFEADPRNPYPSSVTGWTLGGYAAVGVEYMGSYLNAQAPDGTKILVFNNGQRSSGSSIKQTITTEPGKTYDLRFLYGNFGYNPCTQILHVRIDDVANNTNLVTSAFVDSTQTDPRVDPFGLNLWNDTSVRFQATSSQTSLQLSDEGSDTDATDLLLDVVRIVEVDTTAPTITASASETLLWPPNGRTHSVSVTGSTSDTGSGVASASWTLTDSEGQLSGGGSLPAGGAFSIPLRLIASRRGADQNGRVYTVTITATDQEGNSATRKITVLVPHDQGEGNPG